MSVAVSGASGQLGRLVSEYLLQRLPASDVILVTRTPDALEDFASRGAQVRHGSFDEPEGLPAAFAGATRALLISTADLGRRVPQHRNGVDGAKAAGVRHIAYTSILNPTSANPAFVVDEHVQSEALVRGSGVDWTLLRMGNYSEFLVPPATHAAATGQFVHNAGDGEIAYVSRADCAAAAGAVLASDGHAGANYDVTGPELLRPADVAAIVAELTGKPIEPVEISDEQFTANAVAAGFPDWLAAGFATWGQAIRAGALSALSTAVRDLTGQPPRTVREVLSDHLPAIVGAATA